MTLNLDEAKKAAADAANATDEELAPRIAMVSHLSEDDVRKLFPTRSDQEKLSQLMEIVRKTTSDNERTNALVANIKELAPAVVKLLRHLA